jgi:hypothetical protein
VTKLERRELRFYNAGALSWKIQAAIPIQ